MNRVLDALLWPLGVVCPILMGIAWADTVTNLDVLATLLRALQ